MMEFFYRDGRETSAIERLERFRLLLATYQHVWHFLPMKDKFVELWRDSETVDAMNAARTRLLGS